MSDTGGDSLLLGQRVVAILETGLRTATYKLATLYEVQGDYERSEAFMQAVLAEPEHPRGAPGLVDSHELLACSLHPLGLPFAEKLPAGVADFSLEVRGQPDQFAGPTVSADLPAWRSVEATLTQAEVATVDGTSGRRLLRPSTPWSTARDGIVAALVGGGSVVVVVGDDDAALERVRVTENVDDEIGRAG